MSLKRETVRALSAAAQIALTDAEILKYGNELAELERLCAPLLSVVDQETVADGARPMSSLRKLSSLREDECVAWENTEELAALAPARCGAYIRVPRVIGEGETE